MIQDSQNVVIEKSGPEKNQQSLLTETTAQEQSVQCLMPEYKKENATTLKRKYEVKSMSYELQSQKKMKTGDSKTTIADFYTVQGFPMEYEEGVLLQLRECENLLVLIKRCIFN